MRRILFAAAAATLLLTAPSAFALKVAMPTQQPFQRALTSEVVVVGKVTAIEYEMVEAEPAKGVKEKVKYKIGIIKIETALAGVKGLTHIKVGFIPAAEPNPNVDPNADPAPNGGLKLRPAISSSGRVPFRQPTLTKDQEGVFFLQKHPTASFYIMTIQAPPLDAKLDSFKDDVVKIKTALAATSDPMKALKAEKADDRFLAAAALVTKYRTYPTNGQPAKQVEISKEESQLILKAFADASWKPQDGSTLNAMQLVFQMGLTPNDGWKIPPFNGQGDYNEFMKGVYSKWFEANGKNVTLKKFVTE